MSQERLGDLLGVTYQQVQKYERGANRIGSSRLHELCRILDVPLELLLRRAGSASGLAEGAPDFAACDARPPRRARTAARRWSWSAPSSGSATPQVRRRLLDLTRALAHVASYRTAGSDPRTA